MLDEAEAREVHSHRVAYPQIDAEIKAIEAALKQYAEASAPPIPDGTKEEIWNKLAQPQKPLAEITPVSIQKYSNTTYRWLAAASIAGLLLSLGGNYYLYDQWKYTQHELASAKSEK